MRKLTSNIKRLFRGLGASAFVLLATAMLAACGMDDSDDATPASSDTYVQVRLQVAAGSDTRAYGGEEGDGRELGFDNENAINNVTILLYEGDGINDANAGAVKIARAIYFPSVNIDKEASTDGVVYSTSPVKLNGLEKKPYHVIAIANMGSGVNWEDMTLDKVRDELVTSAWTLGTDGYTNFIMSSEKDAELTFDANQKGAGTEENPYTVETTIERVAARIDFDTTNGEYQDGGYIYKVYDSESATESNGGVFVLTHVRPFNELTYGSYLIKRVSDKDKASISYLGDETKDETTHKAINYVLDALSGGDPTRGSEHYTNYYNGTNIPEDGWETWAVRTADKGTETEKYYVLDYTQENTSLDNSTTYATGLFFRGTLYTADEVEDNGAPKADAKGEEKTYVYYIRHSDPDGTGTTSDPMHYGIVRNNIYRVNIDKVIISDEPQGDGLKITLNVRKWAKFTHSDIVM